MPCFSDELRLVLPVDHKWSSQEKVDWKEACLENFILYNRDSYTFRIINEYFDKMGVRLSSFMEISNPDAAKELIKVGIGIGVMANWAITDDVLGGELNSFSLGPSKLTRTWGISVRRGRKLNRAERIFMKIAEEFGSNWMINRKLVKKGS